MDVCWYLHSCLIFRMEEYVHIVAVQSITYILIPTNIHDMQIFSPKKLPAAITFWVAALKF